MQQSITGQPKDPHVDCARLSRQTVRPTVAPRSIPAERGIGPPAAPAERSPTNTNPMPASNSPISAEGEQCEWFQNGQVSDILRRGEAPGTHQGQSSPLSSLNPEYAEAVAVGDRVRQKIDTRTLIGTLRDCHWYTGSHGSLASSPSAHS